MPPERETAYLLAEQLLRAISQNHATLLWTFGISSAIRIEIQEELERAQVAEKALMPPPRATAFQPGPTGRIPFDLFETNDGCHQVECVVWTAAGPTELTLLADIEYGGTQVARMVYRLIETQ